MPHSIVMEQTRNFQENVKGITESKKLPPDRCYLCDAANGIIPAGFHLLYPQKDISPIPLDCWECSTCNGCFVYPIPAPELIARYWAITDWSDPTRETDIATAKDIMQDRLLENLVRWTNRGPLLDFGCNFGQFMLRAKKAGWVPSGFEPNEEAARRARIKGFEVRSGWSLEAARFAPESFNAITVIDVFCLVWDPIATLRSLHALLKPGGVLAMRLTNKRLILGLMRRLYPEGYQRDIHLSNVFLPQFHSIGIQPFKRILIQNGFDRVETLPNATTAPWRNLSWRTRVAYHASYLVYVASIGKVNVSPGILLFARKSNHTN